MPQTYDPQQVEEALAASRRQLVDPVHLLALLPLRPYQEIADIGCGPGFFSIALAKYVFDGRLYAVDTRREMLDAVAEQARRARLTNLQYVQATQSSLGLEPESLDGALLGFSLHDTPEKEHALRQVADALRRNGWLAILEWAKKETEDGPPVDRRLARPEVNALARSAGFRFVEGRDLNSRQYMVVLHK